MTYLDRSFFCLALVFGISAAGTQAADQKVQRPIFPSAETSDVRYNRIVREVRHELIMLPFLSLFDDIAFKVDGDTVTLLGAVVRPTLKSDAEGVVKRIEGVHHVVNQIEVLPLSPMDDRIRRTEARAIFGHPALYRYGMQAIPSIHILVKNGNVTLEGIVANEADKDLVNIQANTVPGVFMVTNNLRVESHK